MTTILNLYHQAASTLSATGIPDPETEAIILLRHTLHCPRSDIFLKGRQLATSNVIATVERILARRLTREPLAYILGEQEFYGRSFAVTPAVLIPRQETELLIEKASSVLWDTVGRRRRRIIDLGTGSGVIAITLALEQPHDIVLAVDRSLDALLVARGNAIRHGVLSQVCFLNSDWSSALKGGAQFDLVAANPPYVARRDQPTLQPELAAEPEMALFGGEDGRDEIKRIINESGRLLLPGGVLLMEIGYDQESCVLAALDGTGGYDDIVVHRDYAGMPRLLYAKRR